ncbi:MAG: chromosome segregation protein SMC [Bacillota bacterium]|nr:chromosome segregation protein SMC [Bacillota bacterium]
MYLKSLEITGFKSFSEKVVLELSPGITAAIGPNGCGKSNLVDAIRWVLGEQSAKLLRGTKMDDLIFNGTTRRKAVNFAEVSLTFDKADQYLPVDYEEVVITRRMYRSGEGEYYINKTSCRLKDITELFYDTGIGTETYSLIGQGRVEQLINAKPEDNRELFEEAAEIHRYKQRKKESRLRLDEMDRNLLRVEDLLAELKMHHDTLSEEATRAGKYRDLSHEHKEIEKKIILKRWRGSKLFVQKMESQREKIISSFQEKESQAVILKDRVTQVEELEKLKFEENEQLKKIYQETKELKERMQGRLNLILEQKKNAMEKYSLKEESYGEVCARISGLEKTFIENEEELKSVLDELTQLGGKTSALKNDLKDLQGGKNLSSLDSLRREKSEKKLQRAALEQSLELNRIRCSELLERISEFEEMQRLKMRNLDTIQKTENEAAASLQRLKMNKFVRDKENTLLEHRRKDLHEQIETKRKILGSWEKEIEKKHARLKYLKESEEGLSLYTSGVRSVMKASFQNSVLKGIHGTFAHLISVPPELEKAVEVALGAKVQFLVTEDDRAAQKAIEYLKVNRAGKATFLPLNLLKPPVRREFPLSDEEDCLGIASQMVEADVKYRKAVEYLLGAVLISRNLESALRLARKNRGSWNIVTLDGEMVRPGGAISGGYQPDERTGFLGRKREIKELDREIVDAKKQYRQEIEDITDYEKRLEEIETAINALALQERQFEKENVKLHNDLERTASELKRIRKEIQDIEPQKSKLLLKYNDLIDNEEKESNEYTLLGEKLSNIKVELDKMSRLVEVEEESCKRLEEDLVEVRIRFSTLQEKESSLQEIIQKQVQEKESLEILASGLLKEKARLLEESRHLKDEEGRIEVELEKERDELQKFEELLHGVEKDLNHFTGEKSKLSLTLQTEQKQLERYERKLQTLNIEIIKSEEAVKYLEEQLLEKFKIIPEKVLSDDSSDSEGEEKLLNEKKIIFEQILAMGEVNLSAIEEYEKLQKRITFLEEQKEDLLSGEKGMRKVLAELDQHMEKQFLEAMQVIEKNFFDIFTRLFGGGQAFLKITEPGNILESGIEIHAQPPGKKLQNISLLSGGEKALTSISLLFALLKYKPVPFCVLDEIDSSLDDSNLARFVRFLKKYAAQTQFIVITHRRKTMEEADVLYGVTMEEQGVSKVVSLNLNKKAG